MKNLQIIMKKKQPKQFRSVTNNQTLLQNDANTQINKKKKKQVKSSESASILQLMCLVRMQYLKLYFFL